METLLENLLANWYLFLALIPVAWFTQNLLHELSHLIVGFLVEGRKPRKLIPWPTKQEGRWYFAYYECGPATKEGSSIARHYSPILMFYFEGMALTWATSYYALPFKIAAIIDCFVWLYGYYRDTPGTDGYQFRRSR